MHRQSGRLIELQILIAAVFIAVAVFIPQVMGGEGVFKSLLVTVLWVGGIIGAILALAFLGAMPEIIRDWYTTPVAVRAAQRRNPLEALSKINPARLDARAADRFGNTALHAICDSYEEERKLGALGAVDFLIQHGAEVNAENTYGKTPLDLAVEHGYGLDIIKRLLAAGAGTREALDRAVAGRGKEAIEVVRALIEAGAPVNSCNTLGSTPLHQAARYGTAEIVRELLARGAEVDARDRDGCTPLYESLWMPSLAPRRTAEIIRVLVVAGADRDAKNSRGKTPRELADQSGDPAIIAAMNGAGSRA